MLLATTKHIVLLLCLISRCAWPGSPVHYLEVVLPQSQRSSFDSIQMFLANARSQSPKVVALFVSETKGGALVEVRLAALFADAGATSKRHICGCSCCVVSSNQVRRLSLPVSNEWHTLVTAEDIRQCLQSSRSSAPGSQLTVDRIRIGFVSNHSHGVQCRVYGLRVLCRTSVAKPVLAARAARLASLSACLYGVSLPVVCSVDKAAATGRRGHVTRGWDSEGEGDNEATALQGNASDVMSALLEAVKRLLPSERLPQQDASTPSQESVASVASPLRHGWRGDAFTTDVAAQVDTSSAQRADAADSSSRRSSGMSTRRSSGMSTRRSSGMSTRRSSGMSSRRSSGHSVRRSSGMSARRSSNLSAAASVTSPLALRPHGVAAKLGAVLRIIVDMAHVSDRACASLAHPTRFATLLDTFDSSDTDIRLLLVRLLRRVMCAIQPAAWSLPERRGVLGVHTGDEGAVDGLDSDAHSSGRRFLMVLLRIIGATFWSGHASRGSHPSPAAAGAAAGTVHTLRVDGGDGKEAPVEREHKDDVATELPSVAVPEDCAPTSGTSHADRLVAQQVVMLARHLASHPLWMFTVKDACTQALACAAALPSSAMSPGSRDPAVVGTLRRAYAALAVLGGNDFLANIEAGSVVRALRSSRIMGESPGVAQARERERAASVHSAGETSDDDGASVSSGSSPRQGEGVGSRAGGGRRLPAGAEVVDLLEDFVGTSADARLAVVLRTYTVHDTPPPGADAPHRSEPQSWAHVVFVDNVFRQVVGPVIGAGSDAALSDGISAAHVPTHSLRHVVELGSPRGLLTLADVTPFFARMLGCGPAVGGGRATAGSPKRRGVVGDATTPLARTLAWKELRLAAVRAFCWLITSHSSSSEWLRALHADKALAQALFAAACAPLSPAAACVVAKFTRHARAKKVLKLQVPGAPCGGSNGPSSQFGKHVDGPDTRALEDHAAALLQHQAYIDAIEAESSRVEHPTVRLTLSHDGPPSERRHKLVATSADRSVTVETTMTLIAGGDGGDDGAAGETGTCHACTPHLTDGISHHSSPFSLMRRVGAVVEGNIATLHDLASFEDEYTLDLDDVVLVLDAPITPLSREGQPCTGA